MMLLLLRRIQCKRPSLRCIFSTPSSLTASTIASGKSLLSSKPYEYDRDRGWTHELHYWRKLGYVLDFKNSIRISDENNAKVDKSQSRKTKRRSIISYLRILPYAVRSRDPTFFEFVNNIQNLEFANSDPLNVLIDRFGKSHAPLSNYRNVQRAVHQYIASLDQHPLNLRTVSNLISIVSYLDLPQPLLERIGDYVSSFTANENQENNKNRLNNHENIDQYEQSVESSSQEIKHQPKADSIILHSYKIERLLAYSINGMRLISGSNGAEKKLIGACANLIELYKDVIQSEKMIATVCFGLLSMTGTSKEEKLLISAVTNILKRNESTIFSSTSIPNALSSLTSMDMTLAVCRDYSEALFPILENSMIEKSEFNNHQLELMFYSLANMDMQSKTQIGYFRLMKKILQSSSASGITNSCFANILCSIRSIKSRNEEVNQYFQVMVEFIERVPQLSFDHFQVLKILRSCTNLCHRTKVELSLLSAITKKLKVYQDFRMIPAYLHFVFHSLRRFRGIHIVEVNYINKVLDIVESQKNAALLTSSMIANLCIGLKSISSRSTVSDRMYDVVVTIIERSLSEELRIDLEINSGSLMAGLSNIGGLKRQSQLRLIYSIACFLERYPNKKLSDINIGQLFRGLVNIQAKHDEELKLIDVISTYLTSSSESLQLSSRSIAYVCFGLRSLRGNNRPVNNLFSALTPYILHNKEVKLSSAEFALACNGLQSLSGNSVAARQYLEAVAELIECQSTLSLNETQIGYICFGLQNFNGKTLAESSVIDAIVSQLSQVGEIKFRPATLARSIYGLQNMTGKSPSEKRLIEILTHFVETNVGIQLKPAVIVNLACGIRSLNHFIPEVKSLINALSNLCRNSAPAGLTKDEFELIKETLNLKNEGIEDFLESINRHVDHTAAVGKIKNTETKHDHDDGDDDDDDDDEGVDHFYNFEDEENLEYDEELLLKRVEQMGTTHNR